MTQTFDQWFQLRLDSLRRQNEWRKIDCLLESKEYVRDAWGYTPDGYALVPVEPTSRMINAGEDAFMGRYDLSLLPDVYEAILAAAPKATHHDNPCSGSNEPEQKGSAYQ